jgi:crotonobetainyl-CoA:carnitine CoA-transferase CaiB-like acyl-CoA transferase
MLDIIRAMSSRSEALPLAGVRVLDLSTSYAGPTATMYLAELGAEVIKVERPGHGDDGRSWGPPFVDGVSAWFGSANRGKKSIVLDLRDPVGRDAFERVLGTADVLVQSFNPGKLAALGLAPREVMDRHPRLVYCAISGFGLTGPDRELSGYDLVAQARSGLMSVTGEAGGLPQRVSTALSDIVAGMVAALAITAALHRQLLVGRGELVDVSLLDCDLALMAPRIASFLAGEPEPAPSGGTDSVLAVYESFATADDRIVLAIGNDAIWRRLCGVLDLGVDSRHGSNEQRKAGRAEILPRIQDALREDTAAAWLDRFAAAGIPAGAVQSLSGVVTDPQVVARGAIVSGTGPGLHGVRTPWRLGSQVDYRPSPAPELGADTRAVLTAAGCSEVEIHTVLAAGLAGVGA